MTPSVPKPTVPRRARAVLAAVAVALAIPANALAVDGFQTAAPSMVKSTEIVAGVEFVPLINVGEGEELFGTLFEGIPDGIGVVPGPGGQGWVDMYVAHEQSHVPFGTLPTNVFADLQDSSVTRLRIDVASQSIMAMDVALPASAGFIRFCSAFMAGPEHGFPHYTFMVNEESNDVIPVVAGAPYGADPSAPAGRRQAGFAVSLDTRTGQYDALEGQGRHNHENTVIVPGGWQKQIVGLSGDDTFTSTSSPQRPNLSQLYMSISKHWRSFQQDKGALYGFRVTGTGGDAIDPEDPFNGANDVFDIGLGDTWSGEFIEVDPAVARGDNAGTLPQDDLEDWSNTNNAFQFIRVEDIAYDPDNPRVLYFADTGNTRLYPDPATGRLWRVPSGSPLTPQLSSSGRIYKMVLNASDPTKVDEFSIFTDGGTGTGQVPMRAPDNLDVGHNSIMVQEDASNAKIWMHSLGAAPNAWTHVATVDQDQDGATSDLGESSGIVDVSRWFGAGWWALDVQAHASIIGGVEVPNNQFLDPTFRPWTDGPPPPGGNLYRLRREAGQLLLMKVPGS